MKEKVDFGDVSNRGVPFDVQSRNAFKLIDPPVMSIIVRWQIEKAMEKAERQELINNMNA